MIKIEKTDVTGWEHAIRGMRNPKNSWEKSDSTLFGEKPSFIYDELDLQDYDDDQVIYVPSLGDNDLKLMKVLSNAGNDHAKYLRMIVVYADISAPLYWWKEYDTYKVGTVANSCSTMHKIQAKEFELDDFSHEHLNGLSVHVLERILEQMNSCRELYLGTKDKSYWWQMIQLLPSSYNQKRTVMLNYQVLKNMYNSRKNHKLDEWHTLCRWIESLPYSELITGISNE